MKAYPMKQSLLSLPRPLRLSGIRAFETDLSCGHLAEYGVVTAQGLVNVEKLAQKIEDPMSSLPASVRELGRIYLDQITDHNNKIRSLDQEIRLRARKDEDAARLMTIPGIGPSEP